MSLIIAKQEGNDIYIVADTKLTYAHSENHPDQKIASPGQGVVKVTIINPGICICFAGDVEGVDQVITVCRGHMDLLRILNELETFHKFSKGQTEFIVAVSHHPFYRIFEIKGLQRSESKSSWIGSNNGFSEFQRYFSVLHTAVQKMSLDFNMKQAFRNVLESSVDQSVNGFLISVSNPFKSFQYDNRLDLDILPQVLPAGYSTLGHGSPQKGGFTVHFFPTNQNFTVLPVHILQGNFGVIYKSVNGGLLWPEVILDISERAFAKIVMEKYGIQVMLFGPPLENL